MKYKSLLLALVASITMSACSDWIFRIDVPQGNFLEEKNVNKLRIGMTKEQVIFVLGHPVVQDSFDRDTWYYVYEMKRGMRKRGEDFRKDLVLVFEEERLKAIEGDYEEPEDFNIPLDQ